MSAFIASMVRQACGLTDEVDIAVAVMVSLDQAEIAASHVVLQ
jgi:hypothetical protein